MPGPGTLFVVATPIGNLEDITHRALRVLREAAAVAAEDTRRTGNLLRHYQIETPLISLHEHNERGRIDALVARLRAGESIALVTDAGTPGVSDPGSMLVNGARAAGVRVDAVPGPSAVTAALSASGLVADRFLFAGFPPVRSKDRNAWFEWVSEVQDMPVVCFEAPHRVLRTLRDAVGYFGERPIIVARELTKVHEEWLQGDANALAARLPDPRGEFVLILSPVHRSSTKIVTDEEIAAVFGQLPDNGGGSRRDSIRRTARALGVSSKAVYTALERHKISGK